RYARLIVAEEAAQSVKQKGISSVNTKQGVSDMKPGRGARRLLGIAVLAAMTRLVAGGLAGRQRMAAEKQYQAWLAAFNSGDRATLLQFLEKNYPERAKEIDGVMEFRAMTGGFELKKTEQTTATRFAALVKEKDSDQFARITMEVQEA